MLATYELTNTLVDRCNAYFPSIMHVSSSLRRSCSRLHAACHSEVVGVVVVGGVAGVVLDMGRLVRW